MAAITQGRRIGPDILKGICAFLIVCIHAPFPGEAGNYFTALTRMAVPVFFMITGYFYDSVRRRGREKEQLERVFRLFLGANLLYFGWGIVTAAAGDGIGTYMTETFTVKNLIRFVFFNVSMFSSHLWYLGALLYVLIIRGVLDRFLPESADKILYAATPALLLVDLLMGKYSLVVFGRTFSYVLVRNFLFVGIPYFTIGSFLYEKRDRIRISKSANAALVALFAATTLLERYLLVRAGLNATRDHYISTTFLAAAAFLLFCGNDWEKPLAVIMGKIGREYSAFIYIIHPMLIRIIGKIAELPGSSAVTDLYMMIRPFVIYIASAILACIYYNIKKRDDKNSAGKQIKRG